MIEEKHHYGFMFMAMFSIVAMVFIVVYMISNSNVGSAIDVVVEPNLAACDIVTYTMEQGGDLISCNVLCRQNTCVFGQVQTWQGDNLIYTALSNCNEENPVTTDVFMVRECVCC